jgi:hypothetical protein
VSLLAYVTRQAAGATDPGSLERTILVIRAAGLDPTSVGGQDLLGALQRHLGPDGSVSDQVNLTAFAVLALRAAGAPVPGRTIGWLLRQHDGDGGFSFGTAGGASDLDDTGAALEALAGVPGNHARHVRLRAARFIASAQNSDGGFPSLPGGNSNAQSTAWAIQGLLAAGANPAALHRGGAPSPLAYLQSLQAADGHIRYAHGGDQTPVWVTGEALVALAGKPFPLAPVLAAPSNAPRSSTPSRSHPSSTASGSHRAAAGHRGGRPPTRTHASGRRHRPGQSARVAARSSALATVQRLTQVGMATVLAFAGVGVR